MWPEVDEGCCVHEWLKTVSELGGTIIKLEEIGGQSDWYRVLCPQRVQFHHFRVSAEVQSDCAGLATRFKNMDGIKEHL
jgi:hypothetical protein